MNKSRTYKLIMISILSALSFILMLISIPLPFFPPFLKMDVADIPAFIGFILFGGGIGILIIILKTLLYGIIVSSEPVGPVANLLASLSFLLPMYLVFIKTRNKKSLIIGIIIGTVFMTIVLALLNYFFLLPLFGLIVDQREIFENLKVLVTAGIIPFNIVKGIILGFVIYIIYIKVIPVLQKQEKNRSRF